VSTGWLGLSAGATVEVPKKDAACLPNPALSPILRWDRKGGTPLGAAYALPHNCLDHVDHCRFGASASSSPLHTATVTMLCQLFFSTNSRRGRLRGRLPPDS